MTQRLIALVTGKLWRAYRAFPYLRGMGVARRGKRVEPLRRPRVLDEYPGEWVAVKDGRVIAHAQDARDVVQQLKDLGPSAEDAVLQRAATPTEAIAVGLG